MKFTEKPDDVDTGQDAHFEIETNAKDGTCALAIGYKGDPPASIGSTDVDDGKCEWTVNIPSTAKTGKAKVVAGVTAKAGAGTAEEDMNVKKGDSTLAGDLDVEVEGDDLPEDAKVGQEITISVKSNVKKSGRCEMSVAWPKVVATSGENKTPDGDGKCSWKMIVPEVPKKGTATLTVVVRKSTKSNSTEYRVLTKEFEVKP